MRHYLYIELHDTYLFIGLLTSKISRLTTVTQTTHPLTNGEVQGIIYNPTRLFELTKAFIAEHRIKKARLILCLPPAPHGIPKQAFLLQMLLCFCKSDLRVDVVTTSLLIKEENVMKLPDSISKKDLNAAPNLLSLFTQNLRTPYVWLVSSTFFFTLLIGAAAHLHIHKARELALLTGRAHEAAARNEDLKDKLHAFEHMKGEKPPIKKAPKTNKPAKTAHTATPTLLRAVSCAITQQSWVSEIELGPEGKKGTQIVTKQVRLQRFNLKGHALNDEEIGRFISNLRASASLGSVVLNEIKRNQGKTPGIRATTDFAISGQVEEPHIAN